MPKIYHYLRKGQRVGIANPGGVLETVIHIYEVTDSEIVFGTENKFSRRTGFSTNGDGRKLLVLSDAEVKKWEEDLEKSREIQRLKARRNVLEGPLLSLRDKARTLCEQLQHVDRSGFHAQFLSLVMEIEESEKVLPSVGLCTSLKPSDQIMDEGSVAKRRKTLLETVNATFTPQGDMALRRLKRART